MNISFAEAMKALLSGNEVELRYVSLEGTEKTFTCKITHDVAPGKLDYIVDLTQNGYPIGAKRKIYVTGILEINKMLIIK